MNLFVGLLCLALNKSYQLYYFVPLISFWFVIMTITLNIQLPFEVILFLASKIGLNHLVQAALVIRGGYILGKSSEYQNRG